MNIGAYCRVSTDSEDQLNSLMVQKGFFEEWAGKNGHNLVRLYADEGISGTKAKNRAEFQRLMQDAGSGLFDMVVVKDISRFARNTVDLLTATRELKRLGIDTLFLTNNMTVLGNSEFVLTVFGALAQEESANTSKRIKFSKQINAEKGRVPNLVYGYNKVIGDYFNLEINGVEAKVIRRIFDLYVHGGYGASRIAAMLNQEGYKTKRDCAWSQNAVVRILKNPIYIGKVVNGKEEIKDFLTGERVKREEEQWNVVYNDALRIIDSDLFEAAQEVLGSRRTTFKMDGERHSNKHLFSTLIKCAECGWSFRRSERTYKNTYVRWICSGRNGNGAHTCSNRTSIDEADLIEALQDYFANILQNREDVTKRIVQEFRSVYKSQNENAGFQKQLETQMNKLKKTRQKYMDMYDDDLISREELRGKMQPVNKKLERIENELRLIAYNLDKGDQLEAVLTNTFKTMEDVVSMEHITNAQLKLVLQKITVDHEGNVDIYIRPFSDLGLNHNYLISDNGT